MARMTALPAQAAINIADANPFADVASQRNYNEHLCARRRPAW